MELNNQKEGWEVYNVKVPASWCGLSYPGCVQSSPSIIQIFGGESTHGLQTIAFSLNLKVGMIIEEQERMPEGACFNSPCNTHINYEGDIHLLINDTYKMMVLNIYFTKFNQLESHNQLESQNKPKSFQLTKSKTFKVQSTSVGRSPGLSPKNGLIMIPRVRKSDKSPRDMVVNSPKGPAAQNTPQRSKLLFGGQGNGGNQNISDTNYIKIVPFTPQSSVSHENTNTVNKFAKIMKTILQNSIIFYIYTIYIYIYIVELERSKENKKKIIETGIKNKLFYFASSNWIQLIDPLTRKDFIVDCDINFPKNAEAIEVNGLIYIIGGGKAAIKDFYRECYSLEIKEGKLISLSKLEGPRYLHLLVKGGINNNNIYAIGGNNGRPLKKCERYSIKDDKWMKIASLTKPKQAMGGCYMGKH